MKREEIIAEARRLKKKADEIEFFISGLTGDHQQIAVYELSSKVKELRSLQKSYEELVSPLPPAEGAEEILEDIAMRIDASGVGNNRDAIKRFYRDKLNTLATLYAQRLAEKMVSERLRGKYVFTYEELRKVCCDFFRSWWNTPGSNTDQGFDAWALKTGLKK